MAWHATDDNPWRRFLNSEYRPHTVVFFCPSCRKSAFSRPLVLSRPYASLQLRSRERKLRGLDSASGAKRPHNWMMIKKSGFVSYSSRLNETILGRT